MNDDGSGMAVVAGFPAASLRLVANPVANCTPANAGFPSGHFALSDAGDVVSLEIDPQLELRLFYRPELESRRWFALVDRPTFGWQRHRRGRRDLHDRTGFDAQGNVSGAGSTELLVSLPLVDLGGGSIGPDICSHDWSPDGTQLVYDTSDGQLVIADLLTGTFDEIVTAGPMHSPQWSPAGDKLMVGYRDSRPKCGGGHEHRRFRHEVGGSDWGLVVHRTSASGRRPAAIWFICMATTSGSIPTSRGATSNGTGKSRLTDASVGSGAVLRPTPLGWRDLPASGSASVPEPSSLLLGVFGCGVGTATRRTSPH